MVLFISVSLAYDAHVCIICLFIEAIARTVCAHPHISCPLKREYLGESIWRRRRNMWGIFMRTYIGDETSNIAA